MPPELPWPGLPPELEPDELELEEALDAELAEEAELELLELPPLDVEVELPPVEVDTLTMVLPPVELPPKKPPAKKPPPKPKPPLLPPTTTGTVPPPVLATATGGGGGGGANMGGMMVRVVTVCSGAGQETLLTVRRTVRRCAEDRRTSAVRVFALAWLITEGRGGGFSATWTAPPPMIAPPQVQAQSLAKAILTDMIRILFLAGRKRMNGSAPISVRRPGNSQQMPTNSLSASTLTIFFPQKGSSEASWRSSVPIQNKLTQAVNHRSQ